MNKLIIVFLVLILPVTKCYSQNEASKWYFGAKAGLDFSTNPPTVLLNSSMNAYAGCASVADSIGNLLFYTNGDTIWNRSHQIMANGTGLLGNTNATQSSLILKQPGSNSKYYVFTMEGNGPPTGLYYSIVDMLGAVGMGSVTVKNYPVFTGPCSEKLTATKHCNGIDYWVIITQGSLWQNFMAYPLTSAGLNTLAAVSIVTTQPVFLSGQTGAMKISPNGKKIGLANNSSNSKSYEILDFDNSNGVVSNPLVLGYAYGYGCEFSPDGTKFYGSEVGPFTGLYQWNLSLSTGSAIASSQIILGSANGVLQLAPNGKIYARQLNPQILSVINYPDSAGIACNLVYNGLSITPNSSQLSLPNFPGSVFQTTSPLTFSTNGSFSMCTGETRTLNVSGATSYTWNGSNIGQSLTVSPNTTSSYSVVGTTSNGCIYKASITLTVGSCLGLAENKMTEFKLFPNPVQNLLNLELSGELENGFSRIQIFNSLGICVKEVEIQFENKPIKLRTDDLPNGAYFITLRTSQNERITKKLVISK